MLAGALGVGQPEEHLTRVHLRPPGGEEGVDLEVVLEPVHELGAVAVADAGPGRVGERALHGLGRQVALVVAQHLGADPVEDGRVDPDRLAVDERAERRGRLGRRVRGGAGQQPPDPQRALDGGHLRGVQPRRGDAVEDVTERAQRHRLLAERGQHAFDVCRVGRRGAHDEDAAGLEAPTVGVEEVGGAVQGDHGLARARPAGDLGDPAGRRPDRLVLVPLDGGDDVAHLGATAAGQGRQQGAVADDRRGRRVRR